MTELSKVRTAEVRYDKSYLLTPLDWVLYLGGQSVGGYGVLDPERRSSRHATKENAELAGAIWIATGVIPAHQTPEHAAALVPARRAAA